MNQKDLILKLLWCLSDAVEKASATEIEDLVSGRASLAVSREHSLRNSAKRDIGTRREFRGSKRLVSLVVQLRQLESREDGSRLLGRAHLSKKEFEELARLMDLPVAREDDIYRLEQKILEESIGARLNSQAIRGS